MTTYETLTKPQQYGYDRGVTDCLNIMSELYDIHGDYSEVETLYYEWLNRVRKLKSKKG